jgi:hypothetical protein
MTLGQDRRSRRLLVLVLLAAAFLLPLLRELFGLRLLIFRDNFLQHWPNRLYALAELRRGIVPFVNRAASNGEPMLANPNCFLLYPDLLLFFALPPVAAYNVHLILHVIWGLFGARRLFRRLGASAEGAILGGACFAFSGLMLSYASSFPTAGPAAAWAPWVIDAAIAAGMAAARGDARRLRRGAVSVACASSLQLLAGEPVVSALTLLLAVPAALAFSRRHRRPGSLRRFLLSSASATLLGGMLTAPLLLAARPLAVLSFRAIHRYSAEAVGAAPFVAARFAEWLFPLLFGNPRRAVNGAFWAYDLFGRSFPFLWSVAIGVGPVVLVGSALAHRGFRRSRLTLAAGGIGLIGLALCFGTRLPLFSLLARIPGIDHLRFPIKCYLWTSLAAAFLTARASDHWLRTQGSRRALRLTLGAAAALLGTALLAATLAPSAAAWLAARLAPSNSIPPRLYLPGALRQLAADAAWGLAALAAVFASSRPRTPLSRRFALLALAIALSLLPGGLPLFVSETTSTALRRPALAGQVSKTGRFFSDSGGDFQVPRFGASHELSQDSYAALARIAREELLPLTAVPFSVRYAYETDIDGSYGYFNDVVAQIVTENPAAHGRLLELAGVGAILAPAGAPPPAGYRAIGRVTVSGKALDLLATTRAVPLVRFATRVWARPSFLEILGLLESPRFHPATDVVIASPAPRDPAPGGGSPAGQIGAIQDRGDFLEFAAASKTTGYAVVNLTYFGYWRAHVDGTPTRVEAADSGFVAVPVPAGRHRVEIFYDSRPFELGAGLSALGLLACLALLRNRGAAGGQAAGTR